MRRLFLTLSAFVFIAAARPALAANPGEKAVLAALDAWKEAMLKKDRAALEKIFHPELTYSHSSATVQDKAQAITAVVDGLG